MDSAVRKYVAPLHKGEQSLIFHHLAAEMVWLYGRRGVAKQLYWELRKLYDWRLMHGLAAGWAETGKGNLFIL